MRRFGVFQLGARRHYAVPRILHSGGMLSWLRTDLSSANWPLYGLRCLPSGIMPRKLRSLRDRLPVGIPSHLIRSYPSFGLRYSRRSENCSRSRHWIDGGREFCRLVLSSGIDDTDGIYGFTAAALEVLDVARNAGKLAVLDQIMAPRMIEQELMDRERALFPGWEADNEPADDFIQEYISREKQEWSKADSIICGSEFVRDGVISCGGDRSRCTIIPYGTASGVMPVDRPLHGGPIRVITVGEVGLRKGSPYVLNAARTLGRSAVFRMVGAVRVSRSIRMDLESHVQLTGAVPRSAVQEHLAWADVFLLPSLCEGSSGAVMEAMASGLPVICTYNTGSTIINGQDGFLIRACSSEDIVTSVELLISDPSRRQQMAREAVISSRKWSFSAYGERLRRHLSEISSVATDPFFDPTLMP